MIEVGQLRRWINPDHPKDKDNVFLVLGVKETWDSEESMPVGDLCWDFIMDGREDWHYDDVITRDSEVISEG